MPHFFLIVATFVFLDKTQILMRTPVASSHNRMAWLVWLRSVLWHILPLLRAIPWPLLLLQILKLALEDGIWRPEVYRRMHRRDLFISLNQVVHFTLGRALPCFLNETKLDGAKNFLNLCALAWFVHRARLWTSHGTNLVLWLLTTDDFLKLLLQHLFILLEKGLNVALLHLCQFFLLSLGQDSRHLELTYWFKLERGSIRWFLHCNFSFKLIVGDKLLGVELWKVNGCLLLMYS